MPPSNGKTQGERIVALEVLEVEGKADRADLWKELSLHKTLDERRFEEIRDKLLGRPSWFVSTMLAAAGIAITACISIIVALLQSH